MGSSHLIAIRNTGSSNASEGGEGTRVAEDYAATSDALGVSGDTQGVSWTMTFSPRVPSPGAYFPFPLAP